jgi:two-component system response regulator AtoC
MQSSANKEATILLVEDDPSLRTGLKWALSKSYQVIEAGTRTEAVAALECKDVDVVLSDLRLPPALDEISEGLAIIEVARAQQPPVPVIIMTASDSKEAALEAVRRGAYGFFEKPCVPEEMMHVIHQAARLRTLEREVIRLRAESTKGSFSALIGTSAALMSVIKQAKTVAATNATVLIVGDNGTGKELLARAIHDEGPRADRPFVAVSCAALPETLIESELFGHEKGAFTGATNARKGRFELADGGTLFLDEISDLSQAIQVKLLRALQERAFERIGSARTRTVDIRLIAASNLDLEAEVETGKFRRDLFHRLSIVPLVLPPLRERIDDVPLLASHFAAKAAAKHGRPTPSLEAPLIEALTDYNWPGNVRELENLIERLVVLTAEPKLGLEFVPEKILRELPSNQADNESTFEGAIAGLKRRMIATALRSESGNRMAAAKRLGISRSYLHRLMSDFGITD